MKLGRQHSALVVSSAAFAALLLGAGSCSDGPTVPHSIDESDAAHWTTWVLASGSEVRPVAPPVEGSTQASAELD